MRSPATRTLLNVNVNVNGYVFWQCGIVFGHFPALQRLAVVIMG